MYNLLEVLLILTALNQRWAFYGLSSSENFAFYKTFNSVGFKFLLFPGIAFLFNGTFKKNCSLNYLLGKSVGRCVQCVKMLRIKSTGKRRPLKAVRRKPCDSCYCRINDSEHRGLSRAGFHPAVCAPLFWWGSRGLTCRATRTTSVLEQEWPCLLTLSGSESLATEHLCSFFLCHLPVSILVGLSFLPQPSDHLG